MKKTPINTAFLTLLVTFASASFATTAVAAEIKNFRQVSPGLFAGTNPIDGDDGELSFQALIDRNVKIDIDFQGTDVSEAPNPITKIYNQIHEPGENPEMIAREKELAEQAGMTFVNLPINSNNAVSREEETRINIALDYMTNANQTQPVYIHCEHGADRTGLVIALFRVLKQGVSIDAANEEWTRYGHSSTARIFTGQLDEYFCKRVAGFGASRFCGDQAR